MEDNTLENVIENQIESIVAEEKITPVHVTRVTTSTKRKEEPKQMTQVIQPNKIELIISNEPIEIINLTSGSINNIIPKVIGRIKLSNNNLYRIPITNKDYSLDNFYAVKHYSKFAEYFRIVSVSNGKVSIVPIISGFEVKSGDVIGELI